MIDSPTVGPAPGLFPISRRKRRPSISYRNLPATANAVGGQVGNAGAENRKPQEKPVMTPRERMMKWNENARRKKQAQAELAAVTAANV